MKTLILLLSIMMITSIATAKNSGKCSEKNYCESEQCDDSGSGNSEQKQGRKRLRKKGGEGEGEQGHKRGRKFNKERFQQRLKRMSKGDEAEYNRLMKLHKEDPEAFRKEMKARRAERMKNRNSKNKESKRTRGQ